MSSNVFDRYGRYYDLLYRDKDYETEAKYVARILRATRPDTKTLLEFGLGTGRHGQILKLYGFEVFGVERSASMVTAARARGLDCVQDDIQTVRLDRLFDGVIALFHVVSYQVGDRDVRATFANAARHLHRDGLFLFDVWHGPGVLSQGLGVRVKRAEDEKVQLTRTAEPELHPDSPVATVRYKMLVESKTNNRSQIFEEEHRMRYFFPAEISELAAGSGFEIERTEEFVTGRAPSENTWTACYLLRKRA